MIEFLKEALGDFAEVEDMWEQTNSHSQTFLMVKADIEGTVRTFAISVMEV